jgi:hypothetical protein
MDLVSAGKVGFPQMQMAMESMTGAGGQFNNMMEAQSKTVLGKWSNMQDAIDQLKVGLGNSQSGLIHAALDFGTTFVNGLASSIKYTNDLNEKLGALHVQLKFGENIDALKDRDLSGNMSAQALLRVDRENKTSASETGIFQDFMGRQEDTKKGRKYIDEYFNELLKGIDKRNLAHSASRDMMNKYDPSKSLINDTEFIRLVAINEAEKRKLRAMRDSFFNKGKTDPFTGKEDKTTGTGTTIEAGTPKNLIINVYGGVGTGTVINSVDGNIPKGKIVESVGEAFLELLNDGYLAMR